MNWKNWLLAGGVVVSATLGGCVADGYSVGFRDDDGTAVEVSGYDEPDVYYVEPAGYYYDSPPPSYHYEYEYYGPHPHHYP